MRNRTSCRAASVAAVCVGASGAFAQDPPKDPLAERPALAEAIEVVARGYEAPTGTATPKVSILDAWDVARRQAPHVADLLTQTTGVYVLRDGPRGQFTRVFTRGAASNQTLVLVDGIPQNDATTGGGYDFNDLGTAGVSQVEVLEGSYGVLYGSEAIGGVVAVTSVRGKGPWRGSLLLEGGSFSSHREAFGAGGGDDAFDVWITAGDEGTHGERRREDFRAQQLGTRIGFALTKELRADWTLRAVDSYVESPFDFPGFGSTVLPEDGNIERRRDTLSTGLTLTLDTCGWLTTRLTGSYLRVDSRFDNGPDGPETIDPDFTPGSGDEFLVVRDELRSGNEARDLRLRLAPTLSVGRAAGWRTAKDGGIDLDVTAGGALLSERSESRTTSPNFNAAGSSTTSIDRDLSTHSLFALAELGLPAFGPVRDAVLAAGARRDDHETFGGESSPYAGVRFDVAPTDTTLRGAWGQGFRAPKPAELDDPFVGSQDLGPETSESFDAGIVQRLLGGDVEIGATWFRLDVDDLIAFDPAATSTLRPFGALTNFRRTRTTGWELETKAELGQGFSVRAAYTRQNPRDRDTGLPLPNRSREFAGGGVAWERGPWLVSLDATWATKFPHQGGEFTYPEPDERRAPGRRTLVDLAARYRLSEHVTFFGRVENLLDDDWVAAPMAPAGPPLGVFAGVQFDF